MSDINVTISENNNENIVVESQDVNVSEATENYNFSVFEDNVITTIIQTEDINIQITEVVGEPGREIELRSTATYIQWRYVGDANWINLVALADLGGGGGGTSLTVVNADGTSETLNVSTIKLDQSTGISITHSATGEVTIGLGSSFKTWKVAGQSDLVAVGEDIVEIKAGSNITITTDPLSNPKSITISAAGGGGAGIVQSIVAGANITVDNTDPANPVISSTGGGGGASDNSKYFKKDIVSRTLLFSGTNESSDSEADTSWSVVKIEQSDLNNCVRTVYTAIGAWANRASLSYTPKFNYEA